jgi:8-oxo-dGTP diphosphatase
MRQKDQNVIPDFDGAKVAILRRNQVLTLLRDDKPDIPWPNLWDLPGGGRDGDEDPIETATRELKEELGITLPEERIVFHHEALNEAGKTIHFFLVLWDSLDPETIRFGDEGQSWMFMDALEFMDRHDVIPHHQKRLRLALASL